MYLTNTGLGYYIKWVEKPKTTIMEYMECISVDIQHSHCCGIKAMDISHLATVNELVAFFRRAEIGTTIHHMVSYDDDKNHFGTYVKIAPNQWEFA